MAPPPPLLGGRKHTTVAVVVPPSSSSWSPPLELDFRFLPVLSRAALWNCAASDDDDDLQRLAATLADFAGRHSIGGGGRARAQTIAAGARVAASAK